MLLLFRVFIVTVYPPVVIGHADSVRVLDMGERLWRNSNNICGKKEDQDTDQEIYIHNTSIIN